MIAQYELWYFDPDCNKWMLGCPAMDMKTVRLAELWYSTSFKTEIRFHSTR